MTPFDFDKLGEECGIFAIYNSTDAAVNTALGLHSLQHRGQEAAGIVTMSGEDYSAHFADGLVSDNFNSVDVVNKLQGDLGIGHVRYSTAGKKSPAIINPFTRRLVLDS